MIEILNSKIDALESEIENSIADVGFKKSLMNSIASIRQYSAKYFQIENDKRIRDENLEKERLAEIGKRAQK